MNVDGANLWGDFNMFHIPYINPLNAELNPICYLLALLGAHHIFHVSREMVNYICKTYKQPTNEL